MTRFGKIILGLLCAAIVAAGAGWYYAGVRETVPGVVQDTRTLRTSTDATTTGTQQIEVVADNLVIPWGLAFLPDGSMLVTERPGRLVHIDRGSSDTARSSSTRIEVDGVTHTGEGGLLGIALHPSFAKNRYLYLYQTTSAVDGLRNRVVRYRYKNARLTDPTPIVTGIAGAPYHDGGRIAFGPDGYLWVTTGDATVEANAQEPQNRSGAILRLHPDGSVPADNPYENGVWSYGHRNPQGLAWDTDGRLWSTEHGRSGLKSGMDEINLIRRGGNYGWPVIEGGETRDGMIAPKAHSGPDVTWAPASAAYHDGRLFFGGLRGRALYEAQLRGDEIGAITPHLEDRFGRIRSVRVGPDPSTGAGQAALYITTSNRDGRGEPVSADDRIIRVDPSALER